MEILLTGATGFVGSHILTALTEAGHTVTALVRSEESAVKVKSRGASALIGAIADEPFVVAALGRADGAIHAASPGDATSADVDAAMVRAVGQAFAGSGKPYLHTAGLWEWGSGDDITEDRPFNPPAIVSWRPGIEEQALATPGARVAVIAAAVVYGDGGGMPNLVVASSRDAAGRLTTIGTGRQHWATADTIGQEGTGPATGSGDLAVLARRADLLRNGAGDDGRQRRRSGATCPARRAADRAAAGGRPGAAGARAA
jgi:nucleoside-diphosphate-sugar epimerase